MESGPVSGIASIKQVGNGGQEPGDERRLGGDASIRPGTNGARSGLSGEERNALLTGWVVGLTILAMITVFDILTRAHDRPDQGVARPLIDEVSSGLVTAVVMWLAAAVAIWMRRRQPAWWRAAAVHVAAAAIYSALHVSGFVGLRKIAYAAFLDHPYRFGSALGEFLYEAAKDVPAYALSATAFWLILRWRAPLDAPTKTAAAPAWFDIRDGARLLRAPMGEILAVRSAGNYAEFLLSDGRRPLMRTSLGGLEQKLAPLGFVRTHRSWLVNSAKVTGLRPEGSGDYAVELGVIEAPLSRRFREALAILRP